MADFGWNVVTEKVTSIDTLNGIYCIRWHFYTLDNTEHFIENKNFIPALISKLNVRVS